MLLIRVILLQQEFEVNDPILPRRKKVPRRYEMKVKIIFMNLQMIYFVKSIFLYLILSSPTYVRDYFHQCGYAVFRLLEDLSVIKANRGVVNLIFKTKFYVDVKFS